MTDSQIGAQKKKSVRNHLFVLNAIISDVLSSVNKAPIDLTVMDYRQLFDAEEVFISLNALYEAGVEDDILALINESNKETVVSVKTPNEITKSETIRNKIMQGDVCLAHLCLLIWWINMLEKLQLKQEISILIKIKLTLLCWQWWMTHWG